MTSENMDAFFRKSNDTMGKTKCDCCWTTGTSSPSETCGDKFGIPFSAGTNSKDEVQSSRWDTPQLHQTTLIRSTSRSEEPPKLRCFESWPYCWWWEAIAELCKQVDFEKISNWELQIIIVNWSFAKEWETDSEANLPALFDSRFLQKRNLDLLKRKRRWKLQLQNEFNFIFAIFSDDFRWWSNATNG